MLKAPETPSSGSRDQQMRETGLYEVLSAEPAAPTSSTAGGDNKWMVLFAGGEKQPLLIPWS
jgi:hypothetical protein